MRWLWLAGAALFAVAALAGWWAFQSPEFVAGLTAVAVGAAAKAIVTKAGARMPPEEEAEMQREYRAGRGDEWLRNRRRGRKP